MIITFKRSCEETPDCCPVFPLPLLLRFLLEQMNRFLPTMYHTNHALMSINHESEICTGSLASVRTFEQEQRVQASDCSSRAADWPGN